MPTFQTPDPITAVVEVVAGSVRLSATERDDTVVEVRPRDSNRASDVRAAEQARIDYSHGTLKVTAGRKMLSLGRGGAVDIDIALPAQSRLKASSAYADVFADGRYGECRFSSAGGDLSVEEVSGNVKADTASGDIAARTIVGSVAVSTASGGATLGHVDGDVKFQTASGTLTVERLRGNVSAQSASGSVSVATAVKGAVSVQTASGDVTIGIPEGTAAQLNLRTRSGAVRNTLTSTDGPNGSDETLLVHVRTASGDIAVHRSAATVSS
ncbi:DUF4097 family beta strand repeat-containing protein [Mycobacterium hubeiense]|uniref:DUF4097 family beta strand repeat-containing protein n=1 Tax=Mycobacterium hubeiense TaxID=1867256 RepID=UPI000C7E9A39|nr:DUF4097 family beta strand repeat-containing protein [Mycobacterium sp. QGD 101]